MKALILAAGVLLLVAGGCNPCKPGSTRCNGSVVEICRPDKKWSQVQDCSKLHRTKKAFQCCTKKVKDVDKCYCCPQTTKSAVKDGGVK